MSTIAIFTGDEGHLSIAQAVAAALEAKHTVKIFFHRGIELDLYAYAYRYLPAAYGTIYNLSRNSSPNSVNALGVKILTANRKKTINKFLAETKPDLCISTYWLFNTMLAEYRSKTGAPFINVLTDPWTIHPAGVSLEADLQLAFDARALTQANQFTPEVNNQAVGWFVRPEFQPLKTSQKLLRQDLGLEDMFTMLVNSGSEGSNMVLMLVPALISPPKPIQVVITCGHNKQLLALTKQLARLLRSLKSPVKLVTLPFTTKMAEYIQAADLVVGKAGPNSLFETVAIQKPFVAITHVPGQEDANLDLIKHYQLGFVEENPLKIKKLLTKLIKSPKHLTKLQAKIKAMAEFNAAAPSNLSKLVQNLLKK